MQPAADAGACHGRHETNAMKACDALKYTTIYPQVSLYNVVCSLWFISILFHAINGKDKEIV